jgi:hypothetical protein
VAYNGRRGGGGEEEEEGEYFPVPSIRRCLIYLYYRDIEIIKNDLFLLVCN